MIHVFHSLLLKPTTTPSWIILRILSSTFLCACACVCVCVCVCVYVCLFVCLFVCIAEPRQFTTGFNNKNHTHTHTHTTLPRDGAINQTSPGEIQHLVDTVTTTAIFVHFQWRRDRMNQSIRKVCPVSNTDLSACEWGCVGVDGDGRRGREGGGRGSSSRI